MQHLGTIGRLGEVEGGNPVVLHLWESQAGSELRGALGTCFAMPPSYGTHSPTCMCCMAWEAAEASSKVTVQPPKPPPVMRLP